MQRFRVLLLLLATIVAACSDDDAGGTSTAPTTEAATTTVASVTTTAATTTTLPTTTTAAPTTTTIAVLTYLIDPDFFPEVFGASGDPNGSGCAPPGDVLPDGVWFGFAEGLSGLTITFDLACYFTLEAAEAAAAADGYGELEERIYVRNQNPKVFLVPIAPTAEVYYIQPVEGDSFFPTPIPLADWPVAGSYFTCPGENCPVWLYVNGGQVTGIVEQFFE